MSDALRSRQAWAARKEEEEAIDLGAGDAEGEEKEEEEEDVVVMEAAAEVEASSMEEEATDLFTAGRTWTGAKPSPLSCWVCPSALRCSDRRWALWQVPRR